MVELSGARNGSENGALIAAVNRCATQNQEHTSGASGVLNGYTFEIATWDGTALVLFGGGPMPQSPAPSDTSQIEPGCDKRIETCFGKFNNVVNHAGEANIPGLNVIGAVSRTQVLPLKRARSRDTARTFMASS